jgi:asparagine synthase (glutamine-hydrolysing)
MCGILAVFNAPTRGSGLRALTLKQSKLLRHRGPDSSGVVVINNNAVAHERLAIVDISSGAQPFVGSVNSVIGSRVILSVNGEIYNHEELKNRQLVPYEFTTNSDCEIILAMYIEVIESLVASNTRITSEVVLDCFMP